MDSNATTKEITTGDDLFSIGDNVEWNNHRGKIRFISDRYITICVKTYPNDDPNALTKEREVCLLCFSEEWKNVEVLYNK